MHYNAIYDAGAVGGGRNCANCKSPAGFNWQTQLRASSWSGFNLVAAAMNKWKVGLGQVFNTSAPLSLWRLHPAGLGKTQVLHATQWVLWNTLEHSSGKLKISKQQILWNTLEYLGKTLCQQTFGEKWDRKQFSALKWTFLVLHLSWGALKQWRWSQWCSVKNVKDLAKRVGKKWFGRFASPRAFYCCKMCKKSKSPPF